MSARPPLVFVVPPSVRCAAVDSLCRRRIINSLALIQMNETPRAMVFFLLVIPQRPLFVILSAAKNPRISTLPVPARHSGFLFVILAKPESLYWPLPLLVFAVACSCTSFRSALCLSF
jgi:hypothetical protein